MFAMPKTFPIVLTADFYDAQGKTKYRDIGTSVFAGHPHITHKPFTQHRPEIGADQIGDAAGVIVLTPRVSAASLANASNLLAVGRFGVGYDGVDVKACTSADVVAYITAGAVDRSVAEATIGWVLALTHNMRAKDKLVRAGQWDERSKYMGSEIRDHTLGVVGLGGIGRTVVELLRGFGMKQPIAFDPFPNKEAADKLGVRLVSLDELMREADYVSLHCPLTEQTRNLIGAKQLALMKPTAYLINTARGGIVNEDALYDALKTGKIAGAALDCFEVEPVTKPSRFGEFENVLLAPHCIAWTDELFRDIGRAVCQGMVDLSVGKRPRGVVNPQVFDRPGFQKKWERLKI
jgi:phosphoglycerate dehydrogenase-like enzyme